MAEIDACPLGLSLVGPRGADLDLLDLAGSVMAPHVSTSSDLR